MKARALVEAVVKKWCGNEAGVNNARTGCVVAMEERKTEAATRAGRESK